MVSLALHLYLNGANPIFGYRGRDEDETSRFYDSICIVLVVVLVLIPDTKLRSFLTVL